MLIDNFFDAVSALIEKIRKEQKENILKAGEMITDSIEKGGVVHLFDTGHLINNELYGRAGGLLLMKRLKYHFSVENNARPRDEKNIDSRVGLAKYVLDASNILPRDVLIISSVSGKTVSPVDLAIEAKEAGIKIIAITSQTYSSTLKSDHPSGKKLYEIADIVLDNCASVGDGMLNVDGIDAAICPASGIAATCIMWALTADIIEKLLKEGLTPSVYKSTNLPDGYEYNQTLQEKYNKTGL